MAQEIGKKNPVFDPNQQAIGCMAHTIHLTACDGLNALGSQPDSISEEPTEVAGPMSIANLVDPPDGLNLNYNSIVSCIAQLASYINRSPQQQEKFLKTVQLVYDESKPTHVTTLLSHVVTRWNSTFEMLTRAFALKDAYHHFCTTLNLKINHALPLYILLIKHIQQACEQYNVVQIEPATIAMTTKLSKYLKMHLQKTPVICATILDPQFKIQFFTLHESTLEKLGTCAKASQGRFEGEARKNFIDQATIPRRKNSENVMPGLFDEMYCKV
ncbi:hypothetical protein O181_109832 [Austropuccinia psidii MF-1]|uniref:hAT-like transposase RNase-H fold domain-containing protein n=1 Tax=Austropuccinia psidii MF-1 TaxID=1389203 RepID=A0A9Q3JWW3_9BASI|nr:hypothetical protein [Austropuccinia psidii MF-1]